MADQLDARVSRALGGLPGYHIDLIYTKNYGQADQQKFICSGALGGGAENWSRLVGRMTKLVRLR